MTDLSFEFPVTNIRQIMGQRGYVKIYKNNIDQDKRKFGRTCFLLIEEGSILRKPEDLANEAIKVLKEISNQKLRREAPDRLVFGMLEGFDPAKKRPLDPWNRMRASLEAIAKKVAEISEGDDTVYGDIYMSLFLKEDLSKGRDANPVMGLDLEKIKKILLGEKVEPFSRLSNVNGGLYELIEGHNSENNTTLLNLQKDKIRLSYAMVNVKKQNEDNYLDPNDCGQAANTFYVTIPQKEQKKRTETLETRND